MPSTPRLTSMCSSSTPAINVRKPLLQMTEEEFDRVVSLNLKGTFRLITCAGRNMAKRGRGSIIAMASIRALTVQPGQGVYSATKAGVVQLCRTLAAELGPSGVPRVNAIGPGVVDTPLTAPIVRNRDGITPTPRRAPSAAGQNPMRWPAPSSICLRRRLLRHRNPNPSRRRLDRGRRPLHTTPLKLLIIRSVTPLAGQPLQLVELAPSMRAVPHPRRIRPQRSRSSDR